jgi:hypothetical protein
VIQSAMLNLIGAPSYACRTGTASALVGSCGKLSSAPSFNGRTSASGAEYWGSNPYGAAISLPTACTISGATFSDLAELHATGTMSSSGSSVHPNEFADFFAGLTGFRRPFHPSLS